MTEKGEALFESERIRAGNSLRILGTGVIVFGLWSVVKPALIAVAAPSLQQVDLPDEESLIFIAVAMAVTALIVLGDVFLRFYIGFSARGEGQGENRGWRYIVLASMILLCNVLLWIVLPILRICFHVDLEYSLTLDALASFLVELTSNVILAELIYNAVKLKRLNGRKGR